MKPRQKRQKHTINTMKTFISDLTKEIDFLIAHKKMIIVMIMIVMTTLYILQKT